MAVVATQPAISTITDAERYWLEIIPYTATIATLPGASSGTQNAVPLFGQLQGWQAASDPATAIALGAVGLTPLTGVRLQVTADGTLRQWDTGAWPWNLEEVRTDAWAIRSLAVQLINTTATAFPNVQVRYQFIVWREPIAMRVLRGWALTQADADVARQVGLSLNRTTMRGTHPLPLEAIIAGSYANRQTRAPIEFSGVVTPGPTATRFHVVTTQPGELLVLRSIAVAADADDGVVITVDRDSNPAHVTVQADASTWQHPLTCLVPARETLAFSVQAAQTVAAPIPIRLVVWRLAISNLLAARMGLETEGQLAAVLGAEGARNFVAHVKAGLV